MKIYIKYLDNKILINTTNYQSINSIINDYITAHNITDNINDFFIDYNGKYLNPDFSLETYNIEDNMIVTLNKRVKGGDGGFGSFAKKHPLLVTFCFLISILPIIILPMGFMSAFASFLKIMISKGLASIGKYLVCDLGKITLYKRMNLIISIFKYLIFALMIYVIITFPLIILCITLKGHSITEDPKKMCKPINVGTLSGIILTCVYFLIYLLLRCGNYILNPIIDFFKKYYISNTLIVPILKAILGFYNSTKYVPVFSTPVIGQGIAGYFLALNAGSKAVNLVLKTVTKIGCSFDIPKADFLKNLKDQKTQKGGADIYIEKSNIKDIKKVEKIKKRTIDPICKKNVVSCCNPKNFFKIGELLNNVLQSTTIAMTVKGAGLFPSLMLCVQALYESALSELDETEDYLTKSLEERKFYLRKLLEEKVDIMSKKLKEMISTFLKNSDEDIFSEIKLELDYEFPLDGSDKAFKSEIKQKMYESEQIMIDFALTDDFVYIPGGSLFKTMMKVILIDGICNVFSTAESVPGVIKDMGQIQEVVDMLKAGTSAGAYVGVFYLITFIILIICAIFKVF